LKVAPPRKDISILLPAYNEAWRIEGSIKAVEEKVRSFSSSYEIIVSEDGSTDGTNLIVLRLSKTNPCLRLLHSPVRLGKGKAIKRAMSVAKGEIVVFMDVDLATSLKYLPQFVQLVKSRKGMVVGSRNVEGSRVKRPVSRTFFSLAYNLIVGVLFLDGIRDHQCGFKVMDREVVRVLADKVESEGFFFDTELILRCKMLGFPLMELGVEWTEPKKKKESTVRLLHDASRIGTDLLKFKLNPPPVDA
jgi:glycosyltransferase involved in cell wall biosynthesis